jgi:hypothetical protein
MTGPRHLALAAAVATVLVTVTPARADDVPADHQVLVFLRVLGYDRVVKARPAGPVVIGLLYRAGDARSEAAEAAMRRAFAKVAGKSLGGRAIQVTSIRYDGGRLVATIGTASPTAVYVCAGLGGEVPAIRDATRMLGILSLTSREAEAHLGLSVAVVNHAGKATLAINLEAARAEKRKLDARLLELAEVIR